jgi:hypothetical protein
MFAVIMTDQFVLVFDVSSVCIILPKKIQRYPQVLGKKSIHDKENEKNNNNNNPEGEEEISKNKKDELCIKLEALGYDVGYRFVERYFFIMMIISKGMERDLI